MPESIEVAMEKLHKQYYNALVSGLHLDPSKFQVIEPNTPLGSTSDKLWEYFDNLPPKTLFHNFDFSGRSNFYQIYRSVISSLKTSVSDTFKTAVDTLYDRWIEHLESLKEPPSPEDLPEVFRNWALLRNPVIAIKGANELARALNHPIYNAQIAVRDQKKFMNDVPNYNKSIQDLLSAILQGKSAEVSFNSLDYSSDVSTSWSGGNIGGFYKSFFGSAGADSSNLSSKFVSNGISISIHFGNVISFSANPGNWYNSAALALAFSQNDNRLWDIAGPATWEGTFGEKGNMKRFVSSLVVVDGVESTITSHAKFTIEEVKQFQASASGGMWPFFSASGGSNSQSKFELGSSGEIIIKTSAPLGNPLIIGANVISVEESLGNTAEFLIELINNQTLTRA